MLASFGIIIPTSLLRVMAVRLRAPDINIETVLKRKKSYQVFDILGMGKLYLISNLLYLEAALAGAAKKV